MNAIIGSVFRSLKEHNWHKQDTKVVTITPEKTKDSARAKVTRNISDGGRLLESDDFKRDEVNLITDARASGDCPVVRQ